MNNLEKKGNKRKRRKARELTLQALYQVVMSGTNMRVVVEQILMHTNPQKLDREYFEMLVYGVTDNLDMLDKAIEQHLDRTLDKLDVIEKCILRFSCYELKFKPDIPYKIIINEGIEVAKIYGATDSYKYINGILDKIAQKMQENLKLDGAN